MTAKYVNNKASKCARPIKFTLEALFVLINLSLVGCIESHEEILTDPQHIAHEQVDRGQRETSDLTPNSSEVNSTTSQSSITSEEQREESRSEPDPPATCPSS